MAFTKTLLIRNYTNSRAATVNATKTHLLCQVLTFDYFLNNGQYETAGAPPGHSPNGMLLFALRSQRLRKQFDDQGENLTTAHRDAKAPLYRRQKLVFREQAHRRDMT